MATTEIPAPYSKASSLKIDELAAGVSQAFFMEHYFAARKPALIKNALNDWPIMQDWSVGYLKDTMRDYQCKIVRDSRPTFAEDKCSLSEYFERYSHLSTFTYSPLQADQKTLPRFLQDIRLPNPFFARENMKGYFFFHANKDGGTLPHCHLDAFNMLQQGAKRWVMYEADPVIAPSAWQLVQEGFDTYAKGSHAKDWFVHGPEQTKALGIDIYEFEQQAGDMVFIPEHFAHAVLNLSEVMGLIAMIERPDKPYKNKVLSMSRQS